MRQQQENDPSVAQLAESSVTKRKESQLLRGMIGGLPIVIGYLPIAVTFGIIATQSGFSLLQTVFMSIMVFAGASQFMAVNMVVSGASTIEM